jgi:hypothetical protein
MSNRPNRPNLAELLAESARKMKEQDSFDAQVKRITEAVKAKLAGDAAKKAETSQSLACPHCGEPLPEGWRTDPVTGDSTDNDDADSEQDNADDDEDDDYDNRKARLNKQNPIRPLSDLTRAQIMASLNKIRC